MLQRDSEGTPSSTGQRRPGSRAQAEPRGSGGRAAGSPRNAPRTETSEASGRLSSFQGLDPRFSSFARLEEVGTNLFFQDVSFGRFLNPPPKRNGKKGTTGGDPVDWQPKNKSWSLSCTWSLLPTLKRWVHDPKIRGNDQSFFKGHGDSRYLFTKKMA